MHNCTHTYISSPFSPLPAAKCPSPFNRAKGTCERWELPQHLGNILNPWNVSGGNDFGYFCANQNAVKLKRIYGFCVFLGGKCPLALAWSRPWTGCRLLWWTALRKWLSSSSSLFVQIKIHDAKRAHDKTWTGQQGGKKHLLLPLNRKRKKQTQNLHNTLQLNTMKKI